MAVTPSTASFRCALACMRPCSRYHDALCACGPSQFDKVALPAIIDYKATEARCEKLPKLLPQLFSEVPEVDRALH